MRHLDTNIVFAYLNGNQGVATRLKAHVPDVAISSLVLAELLYGARLSAKSEANLQRLETLTQLIAVASFDRASADAYARLRLTLRLGGRPTGEVDALIAAVALAHEAVFVTHNTRHFEHVEGLQLEDWL
jgi:tRNA(fMet)-specific endonuclease VapC